MFTCVCLETAAGMALREGIIQVLDKAQTSTVHHAELLKTLRALHDKTELEEFLEAFVVPLCVANEPAVERVLDFVARFAASVMAPLETPAEGEGGGCDI